MKSILLLVFFSAVVLLPGRAFSQNQKGEVKGKLLDVQHKEPLGYATIAVYTAQDTSLVTFRVSDEKGGFRVPSLAVNQPLRIVISMTGFKTYRKEFTLTPEQLNLDLGEIGMTMTDNVLGEVLISAETPPIIVRKDTLEFNANSFKTLPTALLEDLLKKLPGVTVDQAGDISVNGKRVNKILVDGKEFFGNDPKVASRNLPADMIEKVQVVNDPDAVRRDPDLPVNEIPQVINLKLKKGIKQGAFGKAYAGKGTGKLYEAGGILNVFRDTTQISLLGYSNSLNRPGFGFEDISRIGGFNRSGMNSIMVRSDGGFAVNGISFGGTEDGIQQSSGAGGNFNTILAKDLKLNLQYFFGGIDADLDQIVNSLQTLQEDTTNSRRSRDQFSRSLNHRIGGRLDWKIDSLTTFSITPGITFATTRTNQRQFTTTTGNFGVLANESDNRQVMESDNTTLSGETSYERLSRKKKGRSFNFFGNYNFNLGDQQQYYTITDRFYRPEASVDYTDQLRANEVNNTAVNTSFSFTEPFSKTLSAVARFNTEYFENQNLVNTYDGNNETGEYPYQILALSDEVERSGWRNYLTTSVKWKYKDLVLQPGVRFTLLNIENTFLKAQDIPQDYFYVFPSLTASWKGFNLSYNVNVREPSAADLQPVADYSNTLLVQEGNPALTPTISNSVNLNYRKFDAKRSINYWMYISGSISQDAVTRARTIDPETKVQTLRPVNTDGNWQFNANADVNKDYKFDGKRQFSLGASMWFNYTKSLILVNSVRSYGQNVSWNPTLRATMNLNDKLEFNETFTLGLRNSTYTSSGFKDISFVTRTSRTGVVVRLPKRVVWEANFDYSYNSNVAPGLRRDNGRLNVGVTFLFLKNDRAQLKFSVYDLLDQNIGAYRSIRENLVEDYQTVVLRRYGLVTFTYNIRNFGGKVGGTNTFFRF
ncbi:outer membrane beta-barrel protein [Nibribacter ruber]|uniref:Outer membrane beta-barrel protein n=1 Tax=Nibribacter ruber TaxID=2698458 RepID=A0A6P1P258_9BACT|nr:outer membrane beta-barrel protein [Nibribacter ruber]QHL88471.1 outer membrane beta-barrel protein [Nibribacter ruber]